jgi:stage III sporulation protein AD
MEQFLQALAMALLAVILALTLGKQGQDMAALLSIAACCMAVVIAVSYLKPVMDFLCRLEALGNLNGGLVGILFKAVGIGVVSEIASMVCADAGNASLGKALQILASSVILWLSIPVFTTLIELIQKIMGEI